MLPGSIPPNDDAGLESDGNESIPLPALAAASDSEALTTRADVSAVAGDKPSTQATPVQRTASRSRHRLQVSPEAILGALLILCLLFIAFQLDKSVADKRPPVRIKPQVEIKPQAPLLRITHVTRYDYDRLVTLSPRLIRLWPAKTCPTPIVDFEILFNPKNSAQPELIEDHLSNRVIRYVSAEATNRFEIKVEFTVQLTTPVNPIDDSLIEDCAKRGDVEELLGRFVELSAGTGKYTTGEMKALEKYMHPAPAGPRLQGFLGLLANVREAKGSTIECVKNINGWVHSTIKYEKREEARTWQPEETLANQKGLCRDLAYLLVEVLRQKGLAARYVVGYLIQAASDNKEYSVGLHAWGQVYLPGTGWLGLDPTSGKVAAEGYIPLAFVVHPIDRFPVEGSRDKANSTFHSDMKATVLE